MGISAGVLEQLFGPEKHTDRLLIIHNSPFELFAVDRLDSSLRSDIHHLTQSRHVLLSLTSELEVELSVPVF